MTTSVEFMETRKVSLILPKDLHKKLKAIAGEQERSIQSLLENAALEIVGFFERAANAARSADEAVSRILDADELKGKPNDTQGDPDSVIKSANRVTPIPEEFEPWVSQLLHILRENNSLAVLSIKENLKASVRLTDLDGGQYAPPPGKPTENVGPILDRLDAATKAAKDYSDKRRRRPGRGDKTA